MTATVRDDLRDRVAALRDASFALLEDIDRRDAEEVMDLGAAVAALQSVANRLGAVEQALKDARPAIL